MIQGIIRGPVWLYGVGAAFDGISLIVSLAVFLVSFYMFRISRLQRYKFFTVAFFSISLAYFVRLCANLLLGPYVKGALPDAVRGFLSAPGIFLLGYGSHIFFALFGYFLLAIIALKVDKRSVAALIASLLAILIIFSGSYYISYYLTSFVLLSFISYKFLIRYQERRVKTRLFVCLAFIFMALAQAQFLAVSINPMFYVSAYLTLFMGSLFLFFALYKSIKK